MVPALLGGILVALVVASGAAAQDGPIQARSSNPRGYVVDDPSPAVMATGSSAGGGGMTAGSAPAPAGATSGGATSGGVQIQGNTRLNATGHNIDSSAIGTRNTGCTRVGGIGECR